MYHNTLVTSRVTDLLDLRLVLPCVSDEQERWQAKHDNGVPIRQFRTALFCPGERDGSIGS